jgi:ADP-heptose:LPS heptosyltransferase
VSSVLAVRAAGLGDLMVALPAIRALRRALPDDHLTLAIPAPLSPLVGALADDVLDLRAQDSPDQLQRLVESPDRYDVVVNLHGKGPHSHRACQAVTRTRLVAYRCPPTFEHGPDWRPEHETDRWCRLVATGFECEADPSDLRLPHRANSPRRGVLLHVGTSRAEKNWAIDDWSRLARLLDLHGEEVILTGTVAERALTRRVVEAAKLPPRADRAGRTDITTLVDLIASVRLVVCGDTGVGHIATATSTPSVGLHGWAAPEWEPRGGPHRIVRAEGMSRIGLADVWQAVQHSLNEQEPATDADLV